MSNSIICNDKKCYVCGTTYNIHRHHIYAGANRNHSEEFGCWVYLCGKHHNLSSEGIHFNKQLDLEMKKLCQKRFEEIYPDIEFIKIFRRNYL